MRWIDGMFFMLCITLVSCKESRRDVDTSGVKLNPVKILRMEKDMFSIPADSIAQRTQQYTEKYGTFYIHFITQIINDGGIRDSSYITKMERFISDREMREVYEACIKKYPDLDELESGLTEAFKHILYYFPETKLPAIYSVMSGFNYSITSTDSVLAISLEMYLGEKSPYYNMLYPPMPMYRRRNMTDNNMLADCISGWLESEFEMRMSKSDFLSEIIRNGKMLYLHEAMLPSLPDTLRLGCTPAQLEWALENEYNIWAYIIEQKLLYSHEQEPIIKFTGEGPFTTSFGKNSPAKAGNWIGWRIVREYMNRHPQVTVQQLVEETDAQKILSQSKYRPEP